VRKRQLAGINDKWRRNKKGENGDVEKQSRETEENCPELFTKSYQMIKILKKKAFYRKDVRKL